MKSCHVLEFQVSEKSRWTTLFNTSHSIMKGGGAVKFDGTIQPCSFANTTIEQKQAKVEEVIE